LLQIIKKQSIMKKSFKKFEVKEISNKSLVKGGSYGRGDRGAASSSDNRAELM